MKKKFLFGAMMVTVLGAALTGCGKGEEVSETKKQNGAQVQVEVVEDTKDVTTETENATVEDDANVEVSSDQDVNSTDTVIYDGDIEIVLGQSAKYTQDQLMVAVGTIEASFGVYFPECQVNEIVYDEAFSDSMVQLNEEQFGISETVVFSSSFTVDEDYVSGPLNAGETYEGYTWTLSPNSDGTWTVVTSGYQ